MWKGGVNFHRDAFCIDLQHNKKLRKLFSKKKKMKGLGKKAAFGIRGVEDLELRSDMC